MKNLIIILIALLLFFSCKKDNKTTPSTNSTSISGKWYYAQDTIREYKNGVLQSTNNTGGITFGSSSYMTFNADGSGNQTLGTNVTNFTYSISDKTITFNTQGQIEKGTIKAHTDTKLEIYYDDSTTDSGDVIRYTETAYFSK